MQYIFNDYICHIIMAYVGPLFTVESVWKGQEYLTKVVKFSPFPCTIIMRILPRMTGHLFWKAIILGGLYQGVPLYM